MSSAGLRRSMSRARSVQVIRAGKELVGLALGFAELEADGEPVGTVAIIPEILLEVFDRPGGVPGREAGSAHREEDLGAQARALGELARLGHQLVGGVGVGPNQRIVGLAAVSEQSSGKRRRAGLSADRRAGGRPRCESAPRRPPRCRRPARCPPARNGASAPSGRSGCPEVPCAAFPGPRRAGPRAARRWPGDRQSTHRRRGPWPFSASATRARRAVSYSPPCIAAITSAGTTGATGSIAAFAAVGGLAGGYRRRAVPRATSARVRKPP